MDVTTLKQQAARQEREGDLANAIATYREILEHLDDTRAMKRELPLIVKLGDLLAQTGDGAAAVARYEQAAELYMQHGSAKSISVLCLKVLRADHSQTDVYFRFAEGLFDHGHVEAARAVLVDYAERAKLAKTLTRLTDLASRPETEVRHHLEQLFAKVEKRARPPSPAPAPPEAPSGVHEPGAPDEEEPEEDLEEVETEEEPEEEEIEEQEPEEEEIEEESEEEEGADVEKADLAAAPSLVTSDITLPASDAESEPAVAEETPSTVAATLADAEATMSESEPEPVDRAPEPEPVAVAEPEPVDADSEAASVPAPWSEPGAAPPTPEEPHEEPVAAPARGRARDVLFSGLDYRAEKSRPAWLWPAIGAVVVLGSVGVVAMLLTGNGSEPGGGGAGVQESPPTATAPGAALGDTSVADTLAVPLAAVDSAPIDASVLDTVAPTIGATVPDAGDQPVVPAAPIVAPPAVAAADTGTRQPPRIITSPVRADRVLVVEGLQVESVEDLPSATGGYRVVQVLASGEGLAMTVVPIDRAGPIVGGGALRVSPLRGDSAIGTIRFGDNVVTARAALSPSVLERLLRQLVEIERP